MIPYWPRPQWDLPAWLPQIYRDEPLDPFGPLVLLGVILGILQCRRFVKERRLSMHAASWTMFAAGTAGFISAHLASVLFYGWELLKRDPWELLRIANGLSSMGGFIGGALAAVYVLRRMKQPVIPYVDMLVFGLLIGWCGGRLGCSFVHDHPGMILSQSWPAIIGPWPDGTYRYDLGLLELLPTIIMTVYIYGFSTWRTWSDGRLSAVTILPYCAARFVLDFFRAQHAAQGVANVADTRYVYLTMAQWSCLAVLLIGVYLVRRRTTAIRR